MTLPLADFLTVWTFLAVNILSPGPNVLNTISAAMSSGRPAGLGSALGVGVGLGLDPAIASVLVVFAALPTASAAHVLASAFGADRQLVATLIAQTTLLSALSLPLWITIAELVFSTR